MKSELCLCDAQLGSVSSSVNVDVKTAAVTEELVTEEVVERVEAVIEEKAVVEKVPPRLEEFPRAQALKEAETLVLSCKVSGKLSTYCVHVTFIVDLWLQNTGRSLSGLGSAPDPAARTCNAPPDSFVGGDGLVAPSREPYPGIDPSCFNLRPFG